MLKNLTYRIKGGYRDSNPGPPEPQSGALTNCAIPTIYYFVPSKPNSKMIHTVFILSRLSLWKNFRPISNHQLNTLQCLHLGPIYLIVFKGSIWISHLEGGFTLRCLQRLSLPDLATLPWSWSPTDTPVVRPSRSSRTKDSSSQISYAHAG